LFEANGHGFRIESFKIQDVADVGATPGIDRLVIIADHADVPLGLGEDLNQSRLRHIGVLILIDKYMRETLLPACADLLIVEEQANSPDDQVIEVDCARLCELTLVIRIDQANALLEVILRKVCERSRILQLVLGGGNAGFDDAGRKSAKTDLTRPRFV
jgi:hypothetical protein